MANRMEFNMSIFAKIFRVSTLSAFAPSNGANLTTELERRRFSNTMPGETGARAGARFGLML